MNEILKPKKGYKIVADFFRKKIAIPEDWSFPKFNDVVKTNPITKIVEKNIPYIPMNAVDIKKSNFIYFEERILSDNVSLPKFQENDVLFARITPSTENGKTCIIENLNRKGIASSELTILRSSDKVLPKYLYYYVKQYRIRQFAISQMMGTTGRQRVPDYVFKKDLNFELPSLNEQQKIVIILSHIDDLITSTQKVIDQTKFLKKGLMQNLLIMGINHKKFKKINSQFGKSRDIPEEWEVTSLSNICHIRESIQLKSNLYVGLEHIAQNDNQLVKKGNIEEFTSNKNSFHKNDILYGKLRPLLNKVWLATEDGYCSTDILPLQSNEKIIPTLLLLILTNSRFFWYAVSTSAGTKMPRTNWSDMKNFKIFLPPIPEQQKIASIILNIDSQIQSQIQYKEKLETLKKALMQKLLTGEIRVKV